MNNILTWMNWTEIIRGINYNLDEMVAAVTEGDAVCVYRVRFPHVTNICIV